MVRDFWQELVDQLRGAEYRFGLIMPDSPVYRIEFATGLTDAEAAAAEVRFGFRFPPDLRALLQTALPRGPKFPDWRAGDESTLRDWLDRPRQGILFDIEHNGFWLEEWGQRPRSLGEALWVAGELIAAAPRLIPIYGHHPLRLRPGGLPPPRVRLAGPRAVAGAGAADPVLGPRPVPGCAVVTRPLCVR